MAIFFEKKDTKKKLVEDIILQKYNQYYRLAYSYVHNESDALDIVQNGAYKAIKSSHSISRMEYAETWVYRIMLNECFAFLRQRRPFSYEELQEENGIETGSTVDRYSNIDLQRALDSLSKEDKAIVILKFFEGMTLEEIAAILDENVNTIKSRLYRGMRKLRDLLSDEENGTI